MDTPDDTLTLDELAERSAMEPRTIRSYVSKGLIPRPSRGRGAKYEAATLQRLLAIKHLMAETGCTLDYCRRMLSSLDDEEIARIAKGEPQTAADHMLSQATLFNDERNRPSTKEQTELFHACAASRSIIQMELHTDPIRIAGGESWTVVPITDDLVIHIREESEELDHASAMKIIEAVRGLVVQGNTD